MIRINLLPREQVRRPGLAPRTLILLLGGGLLAVVLATTFVLNRRNERVRKEIVAVDEGIERLRPQVARVDALRREIEIARRKKQLLDRLEAARVPWDTILEAVRTVMPKDVWLSQISAGEDGSLNFVGFGLSYTAVARFMVNLEDSPLFARVDLVLSQKQAVGGREVINFSLTGALTLARREAVLR